MPMKIAIAQINTTVGDINGNFERIISSITKAKNEKAELVIFPELTLTGYPPRDLLIKKSFIQFKRTQDIVFIFLIKYKVRYPK